MSNYITYPLLILVIIGSFNYAYTYSEISELSGEETLEQNITGSVFENETETTVSAGTHSLTLDFNMTTGLVVIIMSAIALSFVGFNLLGSGLSNRSTKILWNGLVYYGLWVVFSVLSLTAISSIPSFGILLWFFLTFIYTLGVLGKMGD